jgi:hypothetical protein
MLKPVTDGELLSSWNFSIVKCFKTTKKEKRANSFGNSIYSRHQVEKAGRQEGAQLGPSV